MKQSRPQGPSVSGFQTRENPTERSEQSENRLNRAKEEYITVTDLTMESIDAEFIRCVEEKKRILKEFEK